MPELFQNVFFWGVLLGGLAIFVILRAVMGKKQYEQDVPKERKKEDNKPEEPEYTTVSRNQFRIVDCAKSEQPRRREGVTRNDGSHAVSFGIIGGADGPTVMVVGQPKSEVPQIHMAASSLRFEHAKHIEWRIVFQEIPNEDITVSLI